MERMTVRTRRDVEKGHGEGVVDERHVLAESGVGSLAHVWSEVKGRTTDRLSVMPLSVLAKKCNGALVCAR